MKNYSIETIDSISERNLSVIIVLKDGNVCFGFLKHDTKDICCYNTARSRYFARSSIKQIILTNGLILPKSENSRHILLDITELSELLNKAGYEYI